MSYIPFNQKKPFSYKLIQWPLNSGKGWGWDIESAEGTIEDFRNYFKQLMVDVPECQFEVRKVQNDREYCLELDLDRELMVLIKETNESIRPSWYCVIAFDRKTGKGNWSEGTFETLDEAKWRIDEIQAREGEDAPYLRVNHKEGKWDMHSQFLDDIDREIVKSWGITD